MNNNTAESPNNTDAVSEIEEITNDFMWCRLTHITHQLAVNVILLYFKYLATVKTIPKSKFNK